jgi:hypothetical protein
MSKQFAAFYVSWRDAKNPPLGVFSGESAYARAAAQALEARLNELAAEGWILDRIIQAQGLTPRQSSAFTIVAFK